MNINEFAQYIAKEMEARFPDYGFMMVMIPPESHQEAGLISNTNEEGIQGACTIAMAIASNWDEESKDVPENH